ncbi:GCN5-related N-acetyltransferase [Ferrimonas balearica DSM 9799]|uniref:GCN5-related N-acetyltransferase n=1 Tax=Ferrimonas balearica (strain DSM 9799 / CCM 4581 / KCTC 23876 / PAT) TaxID=550540 RepID=E1SM48_FERBD|nr:GNAT family N-acetyltransferase [Ferrimonas balearica]ADN76566.1 GCN5-related N-acetyltransferase [Ferrimonas balearica DSM 9799]MBW3139467.1 GNAT family N-acetyltransferase [Ferrimonas balearica]MBW3162939.1 GNAT family N-acetyltransferase [Ferrimonas balearica]MBY5980637.1 GNAT family N-acetyltransferase [Ferrimonas balearica]MBY6106535.1 GNAT family N-acetyltransferase [Ferrimonas balearica]
MASPIFTTERLIVRPLLQADLPWFVELEGDPEVMRYTDRPAQTPEQSTFALLELAGRRELDGQLCLWAVVNREGEGLGTAAVYRNDDQQWEMGYKFHRYCWGQGLASELAEALVGYLQQPLKGETLHAFAFSDNVASCRILEKCGFALVREWFNPDYQLLDRHYQLTFSE